MRHLTEAVLSTEKKWKLYKRLLKHDREWLYAQPKNKTLAPHREGRVDWASRDKEWAQLLRAAAAKIGKEAPLVRVTKNAMITKAGISTSIFAYLNRLPLCHSALSECSESREAFRERCRMAGEKKSNECCREPGQA